MLDNATWLNTRHLGSEEFPLLVTPRREPHCTLTVFYNAPKIVHWYEGGRIRLMSQPGVKSNKKASAMKSHGTPIIFESCERDGNACAVEQVRSSQAFLPLRNRYSRKGRWVLEASSEPERVFQSFTTVWKRLPNPIMENWVDTESEMNIGEDIHSSSSKVCTT